MRLIDADELIKNIHNEEMIAKMAIAYAPSIDIVRCRECSKRMTDDCPMCNECGKKAYPTEDDDFCSYGEREGE